MSERREPPVGKEARAEVAERLRSRRQELGLTQAQVGELLETEHGKDVQRSQISRWESGVEFPSRRFRPQVAKALRLDEVDLFGDLSASRPDFESRMDTVEARFWALADLLGVSEKDVAAQVEKRRVARVKKAGGDADADLPLRSLIPDRDLAPDVGGAEPQPMVRRRGRGRATGKGPSK